MVVLLHLSSKLLNLSLQALLGNEDADFCMYSYHQKEKYKKHPPDIIIVDIATVHKKISSDYPTTKIVFLDTGIMQKELLSVLLSYKLHGVLSTETDIQMCIKALKVVHEGQIWLSHETMKIFMHSTEIMQHNGRVNGLTNREEQIIHCVCQGYSNRKIADALSLSEQTVKAHLNRIFRKFNISNRSQLVAVSLGNTGFQT